MQVTVSLLKNGTVEEKEVVPHPNLEMVEAVVRALISEAARKQTGVLWPFQIEVAESQDAPLGTAPRFPTASRH